MGIVAARAAAARSTLPPTAPAEVSVASTLPGHAGGHARGARRGETDAAVAVTTPASDALESVDIAVALRGSPTTKTRVPHVVLVPHRAAYEGVVRDSSRPSGETQLGVTDTPPTFTVVALEKGTPVEKGKRRATRMRWVAPERVRVQGVEGGTRAMATREGSAAGEESTAEAFCQKAAIKLVLLPAPPVAFDGKSNALVGRAVTTLDHEERKLPYAAGNSRRTSNASGSAGGRRRIGRLTALFGG